MRPDEQPTILPQDAQERKSYPLFTGCMSYFPDALCMVARRSWTGQQQHNPGKALAWDKTKSSDELDALMRHAVEGEWDAVAWRALAQCQREYNKGWRPKGEAKPVKTATPRPITPEEHDRWQKLQDDMSAEADRWAVVEDYEP